ncbi:MAG: hypothetical protein OHK0037_36010 [Elainellaceae cyanobacterium]
MLPDRTNPNLFEVTFERSGLLISSSNLMNDKMREVNKVFVNHKEALLKMKKLQEISYLRIYYDSDFNRQRSLNM